MRPRKSGGAFCASPLPGVTPWVLVNYNGQVSDVATLAHELGHAVHALMAAFVVWRIIVRAPAVQSPPADEAEKRPPGALG